MNLKPNEDIHDAPPLKVSGSNQSTFLGIHLSGPNCPKTAVVVLGLSSKGQFHLDQVYEKIGPKGNMFSDDRLMEIFAGQSQVVSIVVDQPLSVPPCVACQRPLCPGVVRCEDVVVAHMMKLSQNIQKLSPSKNRVINPQTQRLWDVLQLEDDLKLAKTRKEVTYQGHLAPLVTRAIVLKKRLAAHFPEVPVLETVVKLVLEEGARTLGFEVDEVKAYKNFERGLEIRRRIVSTILKRKSVETRHEAVVDSVECFQAFICAFLGVLHRSGEVLEKPEFFPREESWVYLPKSDFRLQ